MDATTRQALRPNKDLDAAFAGPPVNEFPKGKRRKQATGDRDKVRRRAFRVLALLSDLPAKQRLAVLRAAERLNRA